MKRRIPGPAGLLDDEPQVNITSIGDDAASAGQQPSTTTNPTGQKETIPPWQSVLSLVFGSSSGDDEVSRSLATIDQIHDGLHDLRVSHLVVFVAGVTYNIDGTISVELQDPTGTINGYASSGELSQMHNLGMASIVQGETVLYLNNVSIYVARKPFQRLLTLHSRCVRAILHMPQNKEH